MTQWHLVLQGRCPPLTNMEQDIDLFLSVLQGRLPGALRIYNWKEPAITLGFHQKAFNPYDPDLSIPVVKRPTGGGAVLHVDDLTFSIAAPEKGHFGNGIVRACQAVSNVFARSLNAFGVDTDVKGGSTGFSDVCFMRTSPVELSVNGTKILGLALLRKKGHILCQGVMPLRTDIALSRRVFGVGSVSLIRGISEHIHSFNPEEFIPRLVDAFASEMGISFSDHHGDDQDQH